MERNMKNKERGQGISRVSEREGVEEGRERESDEAARREGTETGLLFESGEGLSGSEPNGG